MPYRVHVRFLLTIFLTGCGLFGAEPPPPIITAPPSADAEDLRHRLEELTIPQRDLADLAARLGGAGSIPAVARTTPPVEVQGDRHTFWFKNRDSNDFEQIVAHLAYQSDQLNMWMEEGVDPSEPDLARAAAHLEEVILPTNRAYFGAEAQPGIDADDRLNILHLEAIGGRAAGYFSSADLFVKAVNPLSNEREMLYVSLDLAPLGSDAYFSVIAHELLHLIHFQTDANEAAWLDEGLAELAAALNGVAVARRPADYAARTDIQLNNLSHEPEIVGAHYGAAFLFTSYFLSRFGDAATQALLRDSGDGVAGLDRVLQEVGNLDFASFFADWAITNYLVSRDVHQAPYLYDAVTIPAIELAARHRRFPVDRAAGVHQFGVDYVQIARSEPVTVTFTGSRQVPIMATEAHSGANFWSTVPADRSDMTLTGAFDLTTVSQASLRFWTWYEIETDWDYGYVTVSSDAGSTWTLLETEAMTRTDPHGNSYGPALTGISGESDETPSWIEQMADLTPFAGSEILLRFEYVTDDGLHWQGWALDDIAIPEIDFLDDAETGNGPWQAAGFIRHANRLPQTFIVQSIRIGSDAAEVERLPLSPAGEGRWTLSLGPEQSEAILVISGSTPLTLHPAGYRYVLE